MSYLRIYVYSFQCDDCEVVSDDLGPGDTLRVAERDLRKAGWKIMSRRRPPFGSRDPKLHFCPACTEKRRTQPEMAS